MTTKVLTGIYTSGYQIVAPVTVLSIATSGFVEGRGVFTAATADHAYTVINGGGIESTVTGVYLADGGVVVNGSATDTGAELSATGSGVVMPYDAGANTVTNYGTILSTTTLGSTSGVYLGNDGVVVNGSAADVTALIYGSNGVAIKAPHGYYCSVHNFGVIRGLESSAVYVDQGTIINGGPTDLSAQLLGADGVAVAHGAGIVTNYGFVDGRASGASAGGVVLAYGGTVTNGSVVDTSAYIIGGTGVLSKGQISIIVNNFGEIVGVRDKAGYAGVYLKYGGSVVNGAKGDGAALIKGDYGVSADGLADESATVLNYGRILGVAGTGVMLAQGGTVVNGGGGQTGALIAGADGVITRGGEVYNLGTIEGGALGGSGYAPANAGVLTTTQEGVFINGSASDRSALVQGYDGVDLTYFFKATNFGTVLGGGGYGLFEADGTSFVNEAGATVKGWLGAFVNDSTLANYGTVAGVGGVAVAMTGVGAYLVAALNSRFIGVVKGGGYGVLDLVPGTTSGGGILSLTSGGTVVVSGSMPATTFSGFDHVNVEAGDSLGLAGNGTIASSLNLTVGGTLSTAGTLTNDGGLTVSGALAGAGALTLAGGEATFLDATPLTIAAVTQRGTSQANFEATATTIAAVWDQVAGTIDAAAGDRVNFTGTGDTFAGHLSGAGTIAFNHGTDLLTGATLAAATMVVNGAAVTLSGTTVLTGTLSVTATNFTIAAAGATLKGGGTLALSKFATNIVKGASASASLTNVNDKLTGAGQLGDGELELTNDAGGLINGNASGALIINTGASTIANAGTIEDAGAGGTTIVSAVANTGTLAVSTGTLTLEGAVSGAGLLRIMSGLADVATVTFTENVTFVGAGGTLELANSKGYTGHISGFSKTGGTSLLLSDIAFVAGKTKASYSGSATSGVLTITNGTATSKITLEGNYTASTFTVSDVSGATSVADPTLDVAAAPPAVPLAGAMAAFGAPRSGDGLSGPALRVRTGLQILVAAP